MEILRRNNIPASEVALFIPHQANLRIIECVAQRMGLDLSKAVPNIEKYANTTAATIPVELAEAYQENSVWKGATVLLAAFGAGFTWGSLLLRWTM